MKKLTWKDLLNDLLAQSQQEDNSNVADLSDDKIFELIEEVKNLQQNSAGDEVVFELDITTPEEVGALMEAYLDPDDGLLRALHLSQGMTSEQADAEVQRITDLMEQDGLISGRDVVQKALARRAQETPLNVIQGPKTLQ